MDVAKPGKTPADATGRPLIVSHGGILKDPMVNLPGSEAATTDAVGSTASSAKTAPPIKTRASKVLQPISLTSEDADKLAHTKTDEKPVGPSTGEVGKGFTIIDNTSDVDKGADKPDVSPSDSGTPVTETASSDEPTDTSEQQSTDQVPTESGDTPGSATNEEAVSPKSEESDVIDAVADQAAASKAQKQEDKDMIERQQKVAKLIQEKTYFAPVKQAKRARKGKLAGVLIVLLLLVSAGAYAAIDAGVVKPGFDVPIHFIKKDAATATTAAPVVVTPTPQPAASPTPTPTTPVLSTYSSKEYGVMFSYPSAWGDVTAKNMNQQNGATSGTSVRFTFSKQTMVQAGILTKDYKEGGRDGGCTLLLGIMPGTTLATIKSGYATGDSTYNTATYKATTKFLKSTADTLAFERFEAGQQDIGGCSGVSLTGYKAFTTGNYTGIKFLWANPDQSKAVPVTEFEKYKATPNNYLSEKDRSDVLAVIDSAKTQ